jgi:hypothetical protein
LVSSDTYGVYLVFERGELSRETREMRGKENRTYSLVRNITLHTVTPYGFQASIGTYMDPSMFDV